MTETLSDKIHEAEMYNGKDKVVDILEIKEAVQKLKKALSDNEFETENYKSPEQIIDKIFGDKLK